jgi:outer membrane biosynthesis protein TonB
MKLLLAVVFCPVLAFSQAADPGDPFAHYRSGELLFSQGKYKDAAGEFSFALSLLPPKRIEVWAHIYLARIAGLTGDPARARNEYDQALLGGDDTNGARKKIAEELAALASHIAPPPFDVTLEANEPVYSDEARIAGLEGTVSLSCVKGADGSIREAGVREGLGLGLDEASLVIAKGWRGYTSSADGEVPFTIHFRLPLKQSRWHLIRVQFDTPEGASRPVFVNTRYPLGAGIARKSLEEGQLVAAMRRQAIARIAFEIDEHGNPARFEILNESGPSWGQEAIAVVRPWQFKPGEKNSKPIPVRCTLDLVWGARELNTTNLPDLRSARSR